MKRLLALALLFVALACDAKITVTIVIDDADLEAGIAQAQIDAKQQGIAPDQFLAAAAKSGFEQYRGAEKRASLDQIQRFMQLVNSADPAQAAALADILSYVETKLEALQPKP